MTERARRLTRRFFRTHSVRMQSLGNSHKHFIILCAMFWNLNFGRDYCYQLVNNRGLCMQGKVDMKKLDLERVISIVS